MDKSGWDKRISHIGHECLDLQAGKEYLTSLSPAQCCFLGFAIHPTLFWQRNNIDNIDVGEGGWKH